MARKLARKNAPPEPEVTDIQVGRKRPKKQKPEPEPEDTSEQEKTDSEWMPQPLLYNMADACFMLGKISKQMMYRLIKIKQIFPVKIGTRSVFTLEELERFVAERVQESLP